MMTLNMNDEPLEVYLEALQNRYLRLESNIQNINISLMKKQDAIDNLQEKNDLLSCEIIKLQHQIIELTELQAKERVSLWEHIKSIVGGKTTSRIKKTTVVLDK
jgi:FtsZ-binding cell division protein ZapB